MSDLTASQTRPGQADQTTPPDQTTHQERGGWLRYVPPVAALGTAWVLQVIAVTDVVGTRLADLFAQTGTRWLWFAAAALLGAAVASCVEGGAAYLMDLYDKHLLARDSTWTLRLAMLGYVGGSAGLIHWWAHDRHLPELTSWLLAGMSASALFLWTRGSRWRNRGAMRAAGQLDPALPRLPMAAKLLHPWRSLRTLWLISWDPVATTDEARARYAARRTRNQTTRPDQTTPSVQTGSTAHRYRWTRPVDSTTADDLDGASQTGDEAAEPDQTVPSARPIRSAAADRKLLTKIRRTCPDWQTSLPSASQIRRAIGGGQTRALRLQKLIDAERRKATA